MKRLKAPRFVRISHKASYEVVKFKSDSLDGEIIKDPSGFRQIRLNENLTAKQEEVTLLHEALHGISFEYDVGLTEKQVLKLEKALLFFLKNNKEWIYD